MCISLPTSPTLMENGLKRNSGWQNFSKLVGSWFGAKDDLEPEPSQDAFYGLTTKPEELRAFAPGTILRSRGIYLSDFIGFDADEKVGWQIAYVSRGQTDDDAIVTVATIILPPNAGDRSKIVFQAPKTDSASSGCRTSFTFRRGNGSVVGAASEQIFSIDYLNRGYINVIVDYEGQYDAFGAGPTSAHAFLDAMRATLAFKDLKLPEEKEKIKIVGWGYSGGAIAVSFAAQLIDTYAPELNAFVKGWSMGGVPVDLHKVAKHVNGGIAAGLIIGVVQGLSNVYPTLAQWAQDNTNDKGKEMLQIAKTKCFFSFMSKCLMLDILNLKQDSSNISSRALFVTQGDPFQQDLPQKIIEENRLAADFERTLDKKLVPKIPMFVIQSISDEVVPIEIVDELMLLWTLNGATIQYTRVKGWLHVGALFASQDENVAWIADRMDGKPIGLAPGTLQQTNRETAIDDGSTEKILGKDRSTALNTYFVEKYKSKDTPGWW